MYSNAVVVLIDTVITYNIPEVIRVLLLISNCKHNVRVAELPHH